MYIYIRYILQEGLFALLTNASRVNPSRKTAFVRPESVSTTGYLSNDAVKFPSIYKIIKPFADVNHKKFSCFFHAYI